MFNNLQLISLSCSLGRPSEFQYGGACQRFARNGIEIYLHYPDRFSSEYQIYVGGTSPADARPALSTNDFATCFDFIAEQLT